MLGMCIIFNNNLSYWNARINLLLYTLELLIHLKSLKYFIIKHTAIFFSFAAIILLCFALLSPGTKTGNWPCFRGENNMTTEVGSSPEAWDR